MTEDAEPRLRVMSKRCNECLFSSNRIVSEERARSLLADLERRGVHFICHKATLADGQNVMCRGFYDARPGTPVIRLAKHLDIVTFVDEIDL